MCAQIWRFCAQWDFQSARVKGHLRYKVVKDGANGNFLSWELLYVNKGQSSSEVI